MAISIKPSDNIYKDLIIKGGPNKYNHYYRAHKDRALVPFFYGIENGGNARDFTFECAFEFTGSLRSEQQKVVARAFDYLNARGTVLLSTHVGFGKTIMALFMTAKIGLKTLIVVNRIALMNQWKESIAKFLRARVEFLSLNAPEADIYIVNITNLSKMGARVRNFGTLILDEVHLLMSPSLCRDLLLVEPEYLIGLTATPYRPDDSNKLFALFFGSNVIYKPLYHKHYVVKVYTDFKPDLEKINGKVNWNKVLNDQAECARRNALIVDIIKNYELKFIVLCKRVSQILALADLCARVGLSVQAVHGTHKIKRGPEKALIGTVQKMGVGFDDDSLNALIIGADVQEYFIQYMGRVFRRPDVIPYIFDLVDVRCPILYRHYKAREQEYIGSGGIITSHLKTSFI